MKFKLRYEVRAGWPRLTWVARMRNATSTIEVICGSGIERRENWFCEAAWDGEFGNGAFDLTDIVAGSGGRCREGNLVFVSASSMQDRLNYIKTDEGTVVSNSLSAVAAVVDASVDPTLDHYRDDLGTVRNGLGEYVDTLQTSRGDIQLLYYENLVWDGVQLYVHQKPRVTRDFSSFEAYDTFMQETMVRLVDNCRSNARSRPLEPVVALSTGYDSPTVAVWASKAGVSRAVTLASDRKGEDDCGSAIGAILGLQTDVVERDRWLQESGPEIDCIAGSGAAGEVAFAGMRDQLRDAVLLSGFWGGALWNYGRKDTRPVFFGHDGSGLSLTESRLNAGFINCSVPYWGGLQVSDVSRISKSEEMKPWRVPGPYNRPICRRVVETAGVPRDKFGQKKHGASDHVLTASCFLTKESEADFFRWMSARSSAWKESNRRAPSVFHGKLYDRAIVWIVTPVIERVAIPLVRRAGRLPGLAGLEQQLVKLRRQFSLYQQSPRHFRKYVFPWALERSAQKYGKSGNL